MSVEYTLWIQKMGTGSELKNSLSSFGFAVNEIPWPSEETADLSVRQWPGEDGEDVYMPPSGLRLKAYDLDVEMIYKGPRYSAKNAYKTFRDYLTGAMMKIYDPYWMRGKRNVYLKKISDITPFRTEVDEGMSFKATFRVTDPKTEVQAGVDFNGNIVTLG